MNIVVLTGRLTKGPEIRYTNDRMAFGSYTLAVDRHSKNDKSADFIYCRVVGKAAEFAEKYLHKGIKISVNGRIHVDNYKDREGNNRSTTYIQVLNHEFCESKLNSSEPYSNRSSGDGFMNVPDGVEEELPFD